MIKDRTSAESLVDSLDLVKKICPVKFSCLYTKISDERPAKFLQESERNLQIC